MDLKNSIMETTEIKDLFKQANKKLKIAEDEINRPTEDVVTFSGCLLARQSINAMLQLFLLSKSVNYNYGKSLSELLNKCIEVDNQFASIELNKVICNELNQAECESNYCLSINYVTDCIAVANQLKSLVMNKLEITEREL